VLEIRPFAGQRERVHFAGVLVRRQQDARREADPHGEPRALDVGHQELQAYAAGAGPIFGEGEPSVAVWNASGLSIVSSAPLRFEAAE
jgi:hypothetical protein